MIRFAELTVFCLAVSGVVGDYADPQKTGVNWAPSQSSQHVEGVYSDAQADRTGQAPPPCQRYSQSEANQADANPVHSLVYSVQNNESPYGRAQSAPNENLKEPGNNGNDLNYKYRSLGFVKGDQSTHNSANQYKNPNSEYKDSANVISSHSQVNAANAVNQQNSASSPNAPNAARINKIANLANSFNAAKVADQLRRSNFGSENFHSHSNNPATHRNSTNAAYQYGNAESAPNLYQSQNHGPAVAQLNVANQYKNLHEDNFDDQEHDTLLANSRCDDSWQANEKKDLDKKNLNEDSGNEFLQSQHNYKNDDTKREKELYGFINHKLDEDYQERSGKGNNNKADHAAINSDELNDQYYYEYDEFEAYSLPSQQYYQNKAAKKEMANNLENVKPVNYHDDDENDPSVFGGKGKQQLKKSPAKKNNANFDQPEIGIDVSQSNQKYKNWPAPRTLPAPKKQAQRGMSNQGNKNNNENEKDEEDFDKYKSHEDYIEDYKDDLRDLQSRRRYNPQRGQKTPQADCNSEEEAQNELAKNQKEQNPEVEGVDVIARSGRRQKVLVGEHTRVCYACSSASNPTCSKPTKLTTVKYCHKGHDSCITKVFQANGIDILTRDCGTSCNDNIIPGVTPKYNKCSVCHSDLCNGAFSLNSQNVFFICALAVVSVTKYFM